MWRSCWSKLLIIINVRLTQRLFSAIIQNHSKKSHWTRERLPSGSNTETRHHSTYIFLCFLKAMQSSVSCIICFSAAPSSGCQEIPPLFLNSLQKKNLNAYSSRPQNARLYNQPERDITDWVLEVWGSEQMSNNMWSYKHSLRLNWDNTLSTTWGEALHPYI